MESIEEYSHRIFNYAIKKSDETVSFRVKSFLSSCVSHTMHRFTRGLKKHVRFFNYECKTFAVCSFSLLVNCTELESSKRIFSPMCKVFNSEYADDSVLLAKKTLQALIAGRPTDASELKTIMQQIIDNNDDNVE
jgi:hypothetical protein